MQSQEEEHEVVYDVDFDRNRALAKTFAASKEPTAKEVTANVTHVEPPIKTASAQIRQQGLMASFIGHIRGSHGDEDEDDEDGMTSILTFQSPPRPTRSSPREVTSAHANISADSPSLQHQISVRREGVTQPGVLPTRQATKDSSSGPTRSDRLHSGQIQPSPGQSQPTNLFQRDRSQTNTRKTPLSATFGSATQRPAAWSTSVGPVLPKKRSSSRKQLGTKPSLDLNKVYESTHHHRSMAEVLSQATSQVASIPTQHPPPHTPSGGFTVNHEEIEDAGAGVPLEAAIVSPTKSPVPLIKRKDASKRREYNIHGPIGQVIQTAARKVTRDTTLFQTHSATALHQANPALDLPQRRPFVTLCVLRQRRHAGFAVLTSYVHAVSDAAFFAAVAPPCLPLAPHVFIDAVYPLEKAPPEGSCLLQLFAPLHAVAVDGNHPFPLLLGTHLFTVLEARHHCDATLPALS
ncbi:hypothetical protein ACHHYP_16687 [Achlya hypogyna]|uniref:Uncharacterized protein n=1 Tax=Achlya hypogyna TaxID=1202772 RepID=A0A1V9Y632_ACHHY|nr:hypothetical protein ACHHYP_16687 [Achlya hypogyna]